jgi:hypothetical protein
MEASMKIATKQFIFRLTAAGISLALTGAAFGIAVAHSKVAPIVMQDAASSSHETCRKETALDRRQQVDHRLFAASGDQL